MSDMPKPKGGRGHTAPYDTKLMRVPVPMADQVSQLVERYQAYIAEGGDASSPPQLLDTDSKPVNKNLIVLSKPTKNGLLYAYTIPGWKVPYLAWVPESLEELTELATKREVAVGYPDRDMVMNDGTRVVHLFPGLGDRLQELQHQVYELQQQLNAEPVNKLVAGKGELKWNVYKRIKNYGLKGKENRWGEWELIGSYKTESEADEIIRVMKEHNHRKNSMNDYGILHLDWEKRLEVVAPAVSEGEKPVNNLDDSVEEVVVIARQILKQKKSARVSVENLLSSLFGDKFSPENLKS